MSTTIEYRVRPVVRYIVTRFSSTSHDNGKSQAGSQVCGEFDNADMANTVANAMSATEPGSVAYCAEPGIDDTFATE